MVEVAEDVGRQRLAHQPRRVQAAVALRLHHRQVGICDRRLAVVVGLPQGAQHPVAAGVEVERLFRRACPGVHLRRLASTVRQVLVGGEDVGAEEDPPPETAQEIHQRLAAVLAQLAHHPLGGTAVQIEVVVTLQQGREKLQALRPAGQVSGDPRLVEPFQQRLQRLVLLALGAVDVLVGVLAREPGVGIGHVGHEDHAERRGRLH